MKIFLWVSLFFAGLPASFASSNASLAELTAQLPQCAISCLTESLTSLACSPTDLPCICSGLNTAAADPLNNCIMTFCTIKETLSTKNVTSVGCNAPVRDRRAMYNWVSNSFVAATWVAFALRILSRLLSNTKFWWDDLVIAFTMTIGIASAILNIILTRHGLGKDIWTLTFKSVSDMIHVFLAQEVLYFTQISLVKISILFFYLRLFPEKRIRRTIYATIVFNILYAVTFDLTGLFSCRPFNYYWNRWDGEHTGTCLNINALGFTNAGISILLDVWTLILPLTQLVGLNLHWKRKISVAMMLSVGVVVTVVSILRLKSLVLFSNTQNPTWDYVSVGYWSTIEICVGIICACMPSIRILLVRVFPAIIPTTISESSHAVSIGGSNITKSKLAYGPNRTRTGSVGGIIYQKSFNVASSRPEDPNSAGTELDDRDAVRNQGGSRGTDTSVASANAAGERSYLEDGSIDDDGVDLVTKNYDEQRKSMRGWV